MDLVTYEEKLGTGINPRSLVFLDGDIVFSKTVLNTLPSNINPILSYPKSMLANFLMKNSLPLYHYRKPINKKEVIDREALILKLWGNLGIEVPKVIYSDDKQIKTIFYDSSRTYLDLINSCEMDDRKFDSMLDLFHRIRFEARKKQDTNYLHPDPHLENFLWDFEGDKCIPIDPGVMLREGLSFEEIDSSLNLFGLYRYFKINLDEIRDGYMDKFIASFSKKDIGLVKRRLEHIMKPEHMLALNSYYNLKKIVSNIIGKNFDIIYESKDYKTLSGIIDANLSN